MIATLAGKVAQTGRNHLILETGGIGFLLQATPRTLAVLPPLGGRVRLWTSLQVREDSLSLYGFATEEERDFFQVLLGVAGVGPKVALGVLAVGEPVELVKALAGGDVVRLMALPGVGKKLAQRLVLELGDKARREWAGAVAGPLGQGSAVAEAAAALVTLGYDEITAHRAVNEVVAGGHEGEAQDLLKAALRRLAKGTSRVGE